MQGKSREKTVKIKCAGADLLELDRLEPFQGGLKSLSEANYQKLRREIIRHGFSSPFIVWRHEGRFCLLDGHQRRATMLRMREKEGFSIPALPVTWIEADSVKEAREKVLALIAQFGEVEEDGLLEFLAQAEVTPEEAKEDYPLPVDWDVILGQKDLEDGVSGESNPSDDPADTGFTFGDQRFKVKREVFMAWVEELRQNVGFDKENQLKEIKRRLKL